MERRLLGRPAALAATLIFGALGTQPLAAQTQAAASTAAKYKVLVPSVEPAPDAKGNFGKDLAEELRKLILKMPRHEPVDKKEMQEAIRKFSLKEQEMNCIQHMQLAVHMQAELVMCGRFTGASGAFRLDSMQFINAKSQESFKLQPITAPSAKEAASQVFTQFSRYVEALLHLAICYDYLGSNEWDRAITNCEEARKVNPNSPRANMGIGFALFSKAIAANPPDQAALRQALALYKRVLETASTPEQEALRMAGIIAARVGQNEESRKYFADYLELNPGDVEVRIQIANEQSKAGDAEGALRVVEAGMKTDSTDGALLTFAGIYAAQAAFKINEDKKAEPGKIAPEAKTMYETAARYYKKLFDSKNGDVEASIIPGIITTLVVLERAPEAVDIGKRAVANPKTNSAAVLAAYGGALANTGNTTEAIRVFDEALAKNDTAAASLGLRARKADVQLRSGDLVGALATFRAAATAREQNPDQISTLIWVVGYTEEYANKDYEGFLKYIDAAGQFAQSDDEKSKLSYWGGISYYMLAREIDGSKASGARTARPHLTKALTLLEGGAAYARASNIDLPKTITDIRKYLDYLNEVIKRGL
jgi:tetratricopeptide (TPR) repeat protein